MYVCMYVCMYVRKSNCNSEWHLLSDSAQLLRIALLEAIEDRAKQSVDYCIHTYIHTYIHTNIITLIICRYA